MPNPDERPEAVPTSSGRIFMWHGDGTIFVEIPLDDDWSAVYRVAAQARAPIIREMHVLPVPRSRGEQQARQRWLLGLSPVNDAQRATVQSWLDRSVARGGITARLVRRLRPGEAIELVRAQLREDANPAAFDIDPEALGAHRHRGRRGNDDLFYARVAAVYVEELDGRRPVLDTAARLNYSEAYTRDVIHKARRRGLLTSPPRGQAGGSLTDEALKLLRHDRPVRHALS